jgi:hypothetical protein
VVKY